MALKAKPSRLVRSRIRTLPGTGPRRIERSSAAEANIQLINRAIHAQSAPTSAGVVTSDVEEVGRLRILGESERHRILFEWNDTSAEFPLDKCVHEMFEEQVVRTPDAQALVFEGASISYAELNAGLKAWTISGRVGGQAGRLGSLICLERGRRWSVALLAVVKAGCALCAARSRLSRRAAQIHVGGQCCGCLLNPDTLGRNLC